MARTLLAAASLTALGASGAALHAATYAETGDAGQTLATAQGTVSAGGPSGTALTAISGSIGTSLDADIYVLTITNTTTFSATATGGTSSAGAYPIDTSLFLFNSAGAAVMANDDAGGASYQGSLPAGNALLTTLSAGTYYLAVSLSGNEPINLNSQLLFTVDQPTTNVRGTAAGLNPTTESNFNGGTSVAETGTYSIALTGAATAAAVPEPSTYLSLSLGAAASLVFLRRLRRQQA